MMVVGLFGLLGLKIPPQGLPECLVRKKHVQPFSPHMSQILPYMYTCAVLPAILAAAVQWQVFQKMAFVMSCHEDC